MSLRVRNWERFQHYHKRNPPWIRLYNEILDNYEFSRLQDASKWHAVGIWLLASRFDNRIPDDPKWIATRINATTVVDLDSLISAGFLESYDDASNTLAPRKQSATLEGEGETERETSTAAPEKKKRKKRAPVVAGRPVPLPESWEPNEGHRELAKEEGVSLVRETQVFKAHAAANGRTMVDWDAAFRSWLLKAREMRGSGATTNVDETARDVARANEARVRQAQAEAEARREQDEREEREREQLRTWYSGRSVEEKQRIEAEVTNRVKALGSLGAVSEAVKKGLTRSVVAEYFQNAHPNGNGNGKHP